MKLIEQTLLAYQAGASEKVYEIDLCEVGPGRFVVNFRYGRRGTALKDGTRTVAPVTEADARRVYEKLVSSKTAAGYAPSAAHQPAPTPAPSPVVAAAPPPIAMPRPATPAARVNDPRAQAILNHLAGRGRQPSPSAPDARAAGGPPVVTQRDRHLAFRRSSSRPTRAPADRTWKMPRVIWRAGELRIREAAPLIQGLVGASDIQDHCVAYALGRCGDPASIPTLRQLSLHKAPHVARMATAALLDLLPADRRAVESHALKTAHGDDIVWRYIAGDNVLEEARALPLAPPHFRAIRALFKLSEYRCDAELHGLLAHRFETTVAMFDNKRGSARVPDRSGRGRTWMGQRPLQAMLASEHPSAAYGAKTRWYLRSRTWRTLKRLGEANDERFVAMAVGALIPFTDSDARAAYYNVGPFGNYWAFNHLMYGAGRRVRPHKHSFTGNQRTPITHREEPFANLWSANPRALLHLISESGCTPVHEFAIRILKADPAFCQSLPVPALAMMLERPFEATVRFAFELAQSRYVPGGDPDELADLAYTVANCSVPDIRQTAHGWMRSSPAWFIARPAGLARLVVSEHAENRAFARAFVTTQSLAPDHKQALVAAVVDQLLALTASDEPRADDAVETLRRLGDAQVAADQVLKLLSHPLEPVQVLGARLLSSLDDASLLAQTELLWDLLTHKEPSLRAAVGPVMAGLMARNPNTADQFMQMIIASVLRRKLPEGVSGSLVRFLRDTCGDRLHQVPEDVVWRLVRSKDPAAQELGGVLLPPHLNPETVPIADVVALASMEVLSLREACWATFERMVPRLKSHMVEAIGVLEASWEDSRLFAFRFFEAHFDKRDFDATLLVTICDSVRPDVQAYGRRLITQHFEEADGEQYLLQLSEHPAGDVQLFASNYLERYAANNQANLEKLEPYFLRVLGAVNRGRTAKQRTHAFLRQEALRDEVSAQVVSRILARQSATDAIEDREACIVTLTAIHRQFPQIDVPIVVHPAEVRA